MERSPGRCFEAHRIKVNEEEEEWIDYTEID